MKFTHTSLAVTIALATAGCQTLDGGGGRNNAGRQAVTAGISAEPKGAYFVGRRFYKVDYKFWGFVRKSGSPWSTARLVMINESSRIIPDRQAGKMGSDNNYEYKLTGDFSGEKVYEPASNSFYDEFVLKGYELLNQNPGSIFREPGATDPTRRIIPKPY